MRVVLWNTRPDGKGEELSKYNAAHGGCQGPVTFYAIYFKGFYACANAVQKFTAPISAWYRFDIYAGAGGGWDDGGESGSRGRTIGEIHMNAGDTFAIMLGGQGNSTQTTPWNGAGAGDGHGSKKKKYESGGGSGDIRTVSAPEWSSDWTTGLSSRILVAGGGGSGTNKRDGGPGNDQSASGPYGYGSPGGGGGYRGGARGQGGSGYADSRYVRNASIQQLPWTEFNAHHGGQCTITIVQRD